MMPFQSSIDLSSLNGTNGFRLAGFSNNDQSGNPVASAGDVNGDGFADLIIGAHRADPENKSNAGSSYVVFGKPSDSTSVINLASLNGSTGFCLNGVEANDYSGFSVASAGDVNGDGFADLIIGAYNRNSGFSYVVFGKPSYSTSPIDLASLDGSTGFRLDGVAAGDDTGRSVASAGDVNGDGFADLIIGAPYADPNGRNASGASYVVFGKPSYSAATFNLASVDGTSGFRLDGGADDDNSGTSVASAGDVNGDGYADLIVSAPWANGYAGASYVVFGKASGFTAAINLASLNGTDGFRLNGAVANSRSGNSVASAGDVNGDGFADLIIGANRANSYAGASYVVFGKASGFGSSFDLSSLNGANGFTLNGEPDTYSGISVASAGDVNGDGFADLIIGAPLARPNSITNFGTSYVVFGKASSFAASFNLSSVDGTTGFTLNGVSSGDYSGRSVASAGDVNGDGYADLSIGAYAANGYTGSSYVYYSPASGGATYRGTTLADSLHGTASGDIMNGNAGNDTLNGGGGNDTIDGGAGNDVLNGGAGIDTASYASAAAGVTVNLGYVGSIQNTGIAGIDRLSNFENLTGSAYADKLTGSGTDNVIEGGAGNDTLDGGTGNDTASYASAAAAVTVSLALSGAQNTGGAGTDSLTGFENLIGSGYNDSLTGSDDPNAIEGGVGNDTLDGARGDDTLDGGAGVDTASYASYLQGGRGATDIGVTISLAQQGSAQNTGLTGLDTLTNFENLIGSRYNDSLTGSSGDNVIEGGALNDTLDGGAGVDIASYASATSAVTVSLALATAQNTGGAGTDTLTNFENLLGSAYADSLTGSAGDNALTGGGDNDTLDGGAGNDMLDGGTGVDTASYASAAAAVTVSLALPTAQNTGGAGTDTLTNLENLTGSAYADILTGSSGDNVIEGGAGNDTIDGGAGNDLAQLSGSQSGYRFGVRDGVVITSGADGVDQFTNIERFKWGSGAEISIDALSASASNLGLVYTRLDNGQFTYRLPDAYTGTLPGIVNQESGGNGSDIIIGTAQADFINAGAGDDAIDGGAGNDVIDGGLGSNFITGGAGADTFFLDGRAAATSTTWSTITDFRAEDKLTIWGYKPGVSKFLWVENDGAAGYKGATMHSDLDGDGAIDTSVTFSALTQAQLPMPSYATIDGNDYVFFG